MENIQIKKIKFKKYEGKKEYQHTQNLDYCIENSCKIRHVSGEQWPYMIC